MGVRANHDVRALTSFTESITPPKKPEPPEPLTHILLLAVSARNIVWGPPVEAHTVRIRIRKNCARTEDLPR